MAMPASMSIMFILPQPCRFWTVTVTGTLLCSPGMDAVTFRVYTPDGVVKPCGGGGEVVVPPTAHMRATGNGDLQGEPKRNNEEDDEEGADHTSTLPDPEKCAWQQCY